MKKGNENPQRASEHLSEPITGWLIVAYIAFTALTIAAIGLCLGFGIAIPPLIWIAGAVAAYASIELWRRDR